MTDLERLEERRRKRIESRRVTISLNAANRALAERNRILRELRAMPLPKLRAIHKAALKAFAGHASGRDA